MEFVTPKTLQTRTEFRECWIGWSGECIKRPNCRSPLEARVDLLPPSLQCSFNRGLLRGECVRQVELRFGHAGRIMFFDPKLRRESPMLLV
jgi:hypothetical protein